MSTGIFNRTGVRYEVALDVLGSIIAHHSEQIGIEREKVIPDADAITAAEEAKSALRTLREDLDPNDSEAIEAVISRYGSQARDHYQTT